MDDEPRVDAQSKRLYVALPAEIKGCSHQDLLLMAEQIWDCFVEGNRTSVPAKSDPMQRGKN